MREENYALSTGRKQEERLQTVHVLVICQRYRKRTVSWLFDGKARLVANGHLPGRTRNGQKGILLEWEALKTEDQEHRVA